MTASAKAKRPRSISRIMWAAVRRDGDLSIYDTRAAAVEHVTVGEGVNGCACSWDEALAAGWRVAKVRVTEVTS
jgi:hypothetical protein